MRVLVTGICGFVGSYLTEHLVYEYHHEVFGLRRWWEPLDNLAEIAGKYHLVEGDLTDLASVIAALEIARPEIIFHLAAQSQVDFSYLAPTQTMETNGIGTINLLEAVRRVVPEAIVLVVSSPEVYGDVQQGSPITEDFPLLPVSPYALSKLVEDRAAFMYYKAYGLKTIISRGFAHEGPRRPDAFALSNFAKQIALIERGNQRCVYTGNLKATRTYCDVRDMVRAYYLLALKGQSGEAYNICGNEIMTVGEALRLLVLASSLKQPIVLEQDNSRLRPHDVLWQVGDDSKFRKLTGWKPQISFSFDTLPEMLSWWRKNLAP